VGQQWKQRNSNTQLLVQRLQAMQQQEFNPFRLTVLWALAALQISIASRPATSSAAAAVAHRSVGLVSSNCCHKIQQPACIHLQQPAMLVTCQRQQAKQSRQQQMQAQERQQQGTAAPALLQRPLQQARLLLLLLHGTAQTAFFLLT
jgi:hypothetical protein